MNTPLAAADRLTHALRSLDGLSVGDAFATAHRDRAKIPWPYTDDTEMAIGIIEVLAARQRIDQDLLALVFARRFAANPNRGYGPNVIAILTAIATGTPWRDATYAPVSGQTTWWNRMKRRLGLRVLGEGSLGNGAAMRSAPVGAYFSDDVDAVVREAEASAEVTHAHPDGIAGAVAIAVAAAWAARHAGSDPVLTGMLDYVIQHTPAGPTHEGLVKASRLPQGSDEAFAANVLGNGSPITSERTVPFATWCAAKHLGNYEQAIRAAFSVGGDSDTICAMMGGIVAAGQAEIPPDWIAKRERLEMTLNESGVK